MSEILMPRLSDSMTEGTIIRWLRAEGDEVRDGEEIVEIETDKATMGYEADGTGVLHILAQEGSTLAVGAVIGTVGEDGSVKPQVSAVPAQTNGTSAAPAGPGAANGGAHSRGAAVGASPLSRRVAASLGIDLSTIQGSGRYGRILKRDVMSASTGPGSQGAAPATAVVPPGPASSAEPGAAVGRPSQTEPTTRIQQLIARRMMVSRASVPEFNVEIEVDMTAAIELRRQLAELTDTPPSYNDIIIKASAVALARHPRVNGSYGEAGFELHPMVDIGFAVAVDGGLLVPAIRDVDAKTLGTVARETRDLVDRARTGAITAAELENATFTVSNLGMFGIVRFEAIISAPQAAILSAGAIIQKPVAVDGEVAIRPIMSLTLACDHRIVYGADAAAFLSDLRGLLERPLTMVL